MRTKGVRNKEYISRLLYNARVRGIGLGGAGSKKKYSLYSAEELVINILKYRPEPRLVYGLPTVLRNNKINLERLTNQAIRLNLANEFGYILYMTGRLSEKHDAGDRPRSKINRALAVLKSKKENKNHQLLRLKVPHLEDVLKKMQLREEKQWNVLGRFTYDGFRHAYLSNRK
ncbi:MAG: hypothetical protein KAS70_08090 [Planctomycetes bacterium]|nr:hypothetical protein [Planctomycetota bacterium]